MGLDDDNHASTKERVAFHHFLHCGDGQQCSAANSPVQLALPSKVTGEEKAVVTGNDALVRVLDPPLATTGPFSSNYDLGFDREFGSQRKPFRCHSRNDPSLSEASNRLIKSISIDSGTSLMRTPKDGSIMPQMELGLMDTTQPRKNQMLWNETSGYQIKNTVYDKASCHQMRFNSGSGSSSIPQISSTQIGSAIDVNLPKWENLVAQNLDGGTQYSNSIQLVLSSPAGYQAPSGTMRDRRSAPLFLSRNANEEGSRIGIKNSRMLLSHASTGRAFTEKGSSLSISSSDTMKIGASCSEPETMNTSTCQGQSSVTGQMTIIYGGQVHVFDDVHPNKADIIMSLAGSSGAGWATNLPKYPLKPTNDEFSLPG